MTMDLCHFISDIMDYFWLAKTSDKYSLLVMLQGSSPSVSSPDLSCQVGKGCKLQAWQAWALPPLLSIADLPVVDTALTYALHFFNFCSLLWISSSFAYIPHALPGGTWDGKSITPPRLGSGFEPHWRPQPAKLPSFGGYSLETLPYLLQPWVGV